MAKDTKEYAELLKSPKWQKKRLEIMQRDGFKCSLCGDDETTLNVHHKAYSGNPWEVDNSLLKTVCEDCHKVLHEMAEYEVVKTIKRTSPDGIYQMIYAYTPKEVISLYMILGCPIQLQSIQDYATIDLITANKPA